MKFEGVNLCANRRYSRLVLGCIRALRGTAEYSGENRIGLPAPRRNNDRCKAIEEESDNDDRAHETEHVAKHIVNNFTHFAVPLGWIWRSIGGTALIDQPMRSTV